MAMQPVNMVTFKGFLKDDSANWYDYQKLAGVKFPSSGEKVQFTHGLACWIDGEVVGMNSNGGCVIEYGADTYATIYKEESIRPVNWNKNKEIEDLVWMIQSKFVCDDPEGIVNAILAAGYRKCDNNTPPTKE